MRAILRCSGRCEHEHCSSKTRSCEGRASARNDYDRLAYDTFRETSPESGNVDPAQDGFKSRL